MSDVKIIDDIDNPDLKADAITDEENGTSMEPSTATDVDVGNEEESAEAQDDTPEQTDDVDENIELANDSAEDTNQEPESEVEKQDDIEAEEDDAKAQDDTPEETDDEDEINELAKDSAEDTDQEPENEAEEESTEAQDDTPEQTDDVDENNALANDSAEDTDQEPVSEVEKQDDIEAEEESTEAQDDTPEQTDDVDENNALANDSAENTDQEPVSEVEEQDDIEIEEENAEDQGDTPEETDDEDENNELADDSAESTDQTPESEVEKQDDDSIETDDIEEKNDFANDTTEDTGQEPENEAEAQDNTPEETDDVDKGIDKESADEKEKTADNSKLFKILKWTGIILLPLIATATLLFLKPALITILFNKTELQIHTPKTAAIQWTAEELEMITVVGQTLTETEQIWDTIFSQKGGIYKKPDFTIFTDRIDSACLKVQEDGQVIEESSLGTFYCPEERRIYIDLSLQLDLKNRLDIPGDFAQGYIVAHEIGHHVQNLAKISEQIPVARLQLSAKEFEMFLQRMELQADCFAGIWARHDAEPQYNVRPEEFADVLDAVSHYSRKILKQKKDTDIMPDPFTHGSPRLRLRWFNIGFDKGTFDSCNTFTVMEL